MAHLTLLELMDPSAPIPFVLALLMALSAALPASSDLVPSQVSALSARDAGAGSALLALPGRLDAMDSLPSSLAGLDKARLAGDGAQWPSGTSLQAASGALPLPDAWVLGLGYRDEHVSDFSQADPQGGWLGGLGGDLDQFNLGLAKGLGAFSLGALVQGEQAAVSTHPAMRLGGVASLGWHAAPGLDAGLGGGFQARDGQALLHLGLAYGVDEGAWGRLTLGGAGQFWQRDSGAWGLGLEQGLASHLFLRAGVQQQPGQPLGAGQLLTCGLGLAAWDANLDYALILLGKPGLGHCFSLAYAFSTLPGTPAAQQILPPPPDLPQPTPSPSPRAVQVPPAPMATAGPGALPEGAQTQMDLGADPLGQGKALEAQGRIPEAVDAYLEALRQEPGDLLAWKALAAAYGRQGDRERARHCWQRVLRFSPGDADARAALPGLAPRP
jgi:hypothetical protein